MGMRERRTLRENPHLFGGQLKPECLSTIFFFANSKTLDFWCQNTLFYKKLPNI